MIWLKILSNFIKALRSGQTPKQIAGGFAIGFMIGIMPFFTLQTLVLIILLILLDINLAAAIVAFLIASLFAFIFDPLFHSLGFFVLTDIAALQGLWETFYNMPVAPFSRFNNTLVMGSFLIGLVLLVPVYLGIKKLAKSYREGLEEKIAKWKIVRMVTGSKIVRAYIAIRDFGGR